MTRVRKHQRKGTHGVNAHVRRTPMKPVYYHGLKIIFAKERGMVIAGFEKNPNIAVAETREKALIAMKRLINSFPPIVRHTYTHHGEQMRELEAL